MLAVLLNEIHRGTTTQIKQGKPVEKYLADTGKAIYIEHRLNSCRTFKRLECCKFINFVKIHRGRQMLVFTNKSLLKLFILR